MNNKIETVWFACPWCPCVFLNQKDLDRHLDAFRTTGVKPNQFDHKIRLKNILEYRDKREPYECSCQEGF